MRCFRILCKAVSIGHPNKKGSKQFQRGVVYVADNYSEATLKRLEDAMYYKGGKYHRSVEFYNDDNITKTGNSVLIKGGDGSWRIMPSGQQSP